MALNTNPTDGIIATTAWNNTTSDLLALGISVAAKAGAALSGLTTVATGTTLDWTPDDTTEQKQCAVTFFAYKKKKK
tara:strand:- start:4406 stop:4636 length:231 start_codon:yes stop_codon:yes gene_type:complete